MVKRYGGSCTRFARPYTAVDIGLLAQTDTLHDTLSGLATKKLMEPAYDVFGDIRYQRLAIISVAHLYNLRQRSSYLHKRQVWTKTRPTGVPIGERRAPAPNNRPGYARVGSSPWQNWHSVSTFQRPPSILAPRRLAQSAQG